MISTPCISARIVFFLLYLYSLHCVSWQASQQYQFINGIKRDKSGTLVTLRGGNKRAKNEEKRSCIPKGPMGGSMLWRCAESLNLKWNQVVHAKNYFAGGMDDSFFFVAKMSYRSCETTCYSVLVLLHVAAAFGIDTRKYTHKVSVGDRRTRAVVVMVRRESSSSS